MKGILNIVTGTFRIKNNFANKFKTILIFALFILNVLFI